MRIQNLRSPKIKALRRDLESDAPSAVEMFWQEMASQGTPLIEPIPGDDTRMLVTFLWRGGSNLYNVVVVDGIAGDDFVANQLSRLPGTDIWYRSYCASKDTHTIYTFSPNDPLLKEGEEGWAEHYAAGFQPDPLNPHRLWEDSVLRLPSAPKEPWLEPRAGIPAGMVEHYSFRSEILQNERDIWIYTPAGYAPYAKPYPWMLLFDGWAYVHLPASRLLDNLIAERRIPPLMTIFLGTVEGARTRELTCNPAFNDFLTQELLPWMRGLFPLTSDPERVTVGGCSYGGLAAFYVALLHPDIFGNVLAQSGSFWWLPGYDDRKIAPQVEEQNWLIWQAAKMDRLPRRVHLDVGLLESKNPPGGIHSSTLSTNRLMRDVLKVKGCKVHYIEFSGGHDFIGWRGEFPEAVMALFGGPTADLSQN